VTRKQMCAAAAITAMLFLIGLVVWKLIYGADDENGSAVAILTSSIILSVMYFFATLPGRTKN